MIQVHILSRVSRVESRIIGYIIYIGFMSLAESHNRSPPQNHDV